MYIIEVEMSILLFQSREMRFIYSYKYVAHTQAIIRNLWFIFAGGWRYRPNGLPATSITSMEAIQPVYARERTGRSGTNVLRNPDICLHQFIIESLVKKNQLRKCFHFKLQRGSPSKYILNDLIERAD